MIPYSDQVYQILHDHLAGELAKYCEQDAMVAFAAESVLQCAIDSDSVRYPFPHAFLCLLVSRALFSLGHEAAADHYLEEELGNQDPAFELFRLCVRSEASADECWQIIQSQVLRLELWNSRSAAPCWTVDINQLRDGSGIFTELSLYQSLKKLLSFLLPAWDGGVHPTLGIKGLKADPFEQFSTEITTFCRSTLSHWSDRRKWGAPPEVLVLEVDGL